MVRCSTKAFRQSEEGSCGIRTEARQQSSLEFLSDVDDLVCVTP